MFATIRAKLVGIAVLASALFVVLGGGEILATRYFASKIQLISQYNRASAIVADMRANFYELRGAVKLYAAGIDKTAQLALYRADIQTFKQDVHAARALGLPKVTADVRAVNIQESQFVIDANRGIDQIQAGNASQGRSAILITGAPSAAKADHLLDVATADATGNNFVGASVARLLGQANWMSILLAVLTVVIVAFALPLGLLLGRRISQPLSRMVRFLETLARGDLSVQAPDLHGRDELAALAGSAQRMVAGLRALISETAKSASRVAQSGIELQAVAEASEVTVANVGASMQGVASAALTQRQGTTEAARTMHELQVAISQVARGAQEQASQAALAAGAMDDTARSVAQMAKVLATVNDTAKESLAAVGDGKQTVARANSVQDAVGGAVLAARDRMQELDEQTRRIDEITGIVGEIAEQTNLLALNAAIEAARAGESGRGFAVVADSVRELAGRTQEAVKEIGSLLGAVQASASAARQAAEAGARGVASLAETGEGVRSAFERVDRAIGIAAQEIAPALAAAQQADTLTADVARMMASISAITEENSAATEQMAASSDSVDGVISQVASSSVETVSLAEQVSTSQGDLQRSLQAMVAAAQQLLAVGGELETSVARFHLG